MVTRAFRAMGTTVELRVDALPGPDVDAALGRAVCVFGGVERTCSRFDHTSELSRLNASGAARVSPVLAELVRLALDGRARTDGLFDPTVHDAVAGYDRTFEEIEATEARPPAPVGGGVELDGDRVVLDPGARIDLGGLAKGYAVDNAWDVLAAIGPCLVDAGGDIRVRGRWAVAVEGGPTLELSDAAVATSGRDRRAWQAGSIAAHHLIDPRTGRPCVTETLRATVVAPTAVEAEVLAKAAFLGAPVDAPTVLVLENGRVIVGGGLA
jgi:thiamine biosynthesis lipoprotein